VSDCGAIRVFPRDGEWLVDSGSSVCAYCATRSEAIRAATEAARDQGRELEIPVGPSFGFVRSLPGIRLRGRDADGIAQTDSVALAEDVHRRLAAACMEALAHLLEGSDPASATDPEIARRTLLTNLARAERDCGVPLTQHEERQLDRLIAAQPPHSRSPYTEARNTSPRHLLYMLRSLEPHPDPTPGVPER
jgi:hypothetical protein